MRRRPSINAQEETDGKDGLGSKIIELGEKQPLDEQKKKAMRFVNRDSTGEEEE